MNRLLILTITILAAALFFGCGEDETCSDGLMNQDESGVDCGGVCTACNDAPVITITSPEDGMVVTASEVILAGTATDDKELTRLNFMSGTTSLILDSDFNLEPEIDKANVQFNARLSLTGIPPGAYSIIVTGTDEEGLEGAATVNYTIQ